MASQNTGMHRASRQNYSAQARVRLAPPLKKKSRIKIPLQLGGIDIPMLGIVLVLLLFGLVMLFSASYPSGYLRRGDSYNFIESQLRYAVLGVFAMVVASFVDYRIFRKLAWPIAIAAFMMLIIVLFMPEKNSAHRWIWLDLNQSRGFQPSEIAKFALIVVFAKMLAINQKRMKHFQYGVLPFMMVLGLMCILLVLEPHLSCTILVIGIGVSMMFAGGTRLRWLVGMGAGVVGGAYLVVTQAPQLLPSYAISRIEVWLDPFSADPTSAHQTIQALIAVGSGGVTGLGIGDSVQKYLYLPEVYNDYIYAILCEELGMIGGIVVMLLYLALFVRGIYIAMRAQDRFGSMLVIGTSVQIALQAFLHVAVNLNAIPSTGISLPFFSYGGTSLVMLLGQVGVLLSVSRSANKAQQKAEMPPVQALNTVRQSRQSRQREVG